MKFPIETDDADKNGDTYNQNLPNISGKLNKNGFIVLNCY
jgi:hypothetical protein